MRSCRHAETRRTGPAILTLLFRMRWAVLVLLVLGSAAGGYGWFHDATPRPILLLLSAAALVLVGFVSFIHLRHVGLAAVTAAAPLLGIVAAGLWSRGLGIAEILAIYGAGSIAAGLAGGEIVRRILQEGVDGAARLALARLFVPCVLATLAGAALLAAWLFRATPMLAVHTAGVLVASVAYGALGTTFGASVLPFGEGFHTAANLVRESRERMLRITTAIAETRWALSVTGIALVLGVLGWFGAGPFLAHTSLIYKPAIWGAAALGVFLVTFAAGRDWREGVAATLALAAFNLVVLWLWGAATEHHLRVTTIQIVIASSAAFLPMLAIIRGGWRFRVSGDEPSVARLRALENLGAAPYFAVAAAVAAMLPWILLHRSIAALEVSFLFGGGAAVILQPAVATALDAKAS